MTQARLLSWVAALSRRQVEAWALLKEAEYTIHIISLILEQRLFIDFIGSGGIELMGFYGVFKDRYAEKPTILVTPISFSPHRWQVAVV